MRKLVEAARMALRHSWDDDVPSTIVGVKRSIRAVPPQEASALEQALLDFDTADADVAAECAERAR